MSLSDWERNGWVTAHHVTLREIADIFAVVDRDLNDSKADGLSPDWALNIAYNAALQSATAALAAAGYRASRDQHHYRVIQSLELTLGADRRLVDRFDAFRKKRNFAGYERAGSVSEGEAREMRELATKIRGDVRAWLRRNHAKLITGR